MEKYINHMIHVKHQQIQSFKIACINDSAEPQEPPVEREVSRNLERLLISASWEEASIEEASQHYKWLRWI